MTKPPRVTSGQASTADAGLSEREYFAQLFGAFLRENFRDPMQVTQSFPGIHFSTAQKLMAGKHCPSGWMVGAAFGMFPLSASRHLAVEYAAPAPAPLRLTAVQEAEVRRRIATPPAVTPPRSRPELRLAPDSAPGVRP